MKLKWIGHSCFLVTSNTGTKIITDPYTPGGGVQYEPINESANIVTVSHEHHDHNAVSFVGGNPRIVREEGEQTVEGIKIRGIACYHDDSSGTQRGNNVIFCFTVDGIRVCHLGDLGHRLDSDKLNELGDIDVLLIPVGGHFTMDARVATEVCDDIKPGIAIPMHFKTPKLQFPIVGVEDFLAGKNNVKIMNSSEIEVDKGQLPEITEIVILQPAS